MTLLFLLLLKFITAGDAYCCVFEIKAPLATAAPLTTMADFDRRLGANRPLIENGIDSFLINHYIASVCIVSANCLALPCLCVRLHTEH